MSNKVKVTVAVLSLAVAFASGRFLTPVKVKTEIKTVEVEKKVDTKKESVNQQKKMKKVVVVVTKPDGTKTSTTTISQDTSTVDLSNTTQTDVSMKSEDKTKEVTKSSGFLSVSALAGANVTNGAFTFGAHVQKSIVGPLSIGLFGLSNGTVGGSVGINF